MRKLFAQLSEQLKNGADTVLVSVVSGDGSTPRGAGANMLVTAEGRTCGTIGGGAVEFESIGAALDVLKGTGSCSARYSLRENKDQDLGMVCGGDMLVAFRFFPANDAEAAALADKLCADAAAGTGTVYIFGGGHVAQALVPALAAVDFRCVILEDREDFCRPELFPLAEEALLIDNSRVSDYITVSADDYVVIVTRGHKDDQSVLAQALKTPARYIGMIGSKSKSAHVFANLREAGFTEDDIKRVITPIGLAIKAETPEEIAVSITAQLILERAEGAAERRHHN
ncbi:MAG: xanthine dehydrogenase accessory protein XdhC [Defluviitaleaceae bacterium]|nr:xanthine dehydrogenase accessory protein XdhC [Defluviitaleaceae bacterium]